MERMVVSVFNSRSDAEEARRRLVEHGFEDARICAESGETMTAADAETRANADAARYARAVREGKSVVAVQVSEEAAATRAAAILDALALEVDKTLSPAEVYALPNSPVDWWESFEGGKLTLRDFPADPGRPEDLIFDAGTLGTDELREFAREQAAERGKDKSSG